MAINSKLKQASNQQARTQIQRKRRKERETETETESESESRATAKWFAGPVKRISGAGNGHMINTVVAGIVELE